MGKKFARIAVVDATLIKLSLAAYDWAAYREQTGATKFSAVINWARAIPQQLVLTSGIVHELQAAVFDWLDNWTYIFVSLRQKCVISGLNYASPISMMTMTERI